MPNTQQVQIAGTPAGTSVPVVSNESDTLARELNRIGPVMHLRQPFTDIAYEAYPDGTVSALTGYPSAYPHVIRRGANWSPSAMFLGRLPEVTPAPQIDMNVIYGLLRSAMRRGGGGAGGAGGTGQAKQAAPKDQTQRKTDLPYTETVQGDIFRPAPAEQAAATPASAPAPSSTDGTGLQDPYSAYLQDIMTNGIPVDDMIAADTRSAEGPAPQRLAQEIIRSQVPQIDFTAPQAPAPQAPYTETLPGYAPVPSMEQLFPTPAPTYRATPQDIREEILRQYMLQQQGRRGPAILAR